MNLNSFISKHVTSYLKFLQTNQNYSPKAMVVKLDFKTDFTRFLKVENKIQHTVKVITKSEVIECSGAVLCQHSGILQQLVAKDNELFLDNYTHVQDCLLVLHGAEVSLNMDNILDIMKFSVQFGINEIYLQCLDWIEINFSVENFLKIFKICDSVSKFARLCGTELPKDPCIHVATYLKMVGPDALVDLYKCDSETNQTDLLKFLFETKGLVCCFADLLCEIVSEENAPIVLPMLCNSFDEFKKFSEKNFRFLIAKIEATSVANLVPKDYVKFKGKIWSILMEAQQQPFSNHYFDGVICITDVIVKDKLWKKMNKDQIIEAQRLFDTRSKHFIYSEIMVAWVVENKPTQETVTELLLELKPYQLGPDYVSMLNDKFKALGYTEPISAPLLSTWKRPNHFISNTVYHHDVSNGFGMRFKIHCRSTCEPSQYYVVRLSPREKGEQGFHWAWYLNNTSYTDPDDLLRCPLDTVQDTVEKERIMFYGATKDNVHLQFHTDHADAFSKWKTGLHQLNVKCVQFDKLSN